MNYAWTLFVAICLERIAHVYRELRDDQAGFLCKVTGARRRSWMPASFAVGAVAAVLIPALLAILHHPAWWLVAAGALATDGLVLHWAVGYVLDEPSPAGRLVPLQLVLAAVALHTGFGKFGLMTEFDGLFIETMATVGALALGASLFLSVLILLEVLAQRDWDATKARMAEEAAALAERGALTAGQKAMVEKAIDEAPKRRIRTA